LRFADGEGDEIDEVEPFVTYQQRKKPVTRRKYSDTVKLIYNGEEEYDYIPEQPIRYRWTTTDGDTLKSKKEYYKNIV